MGTTKIVLEQLESGDFQIMSEEGYARLTLMRTKEGQVELVGESVERLSLGELQELKRQVEAGFKAVGENNARMLENNDLRKKLDARIDELVAQTERLALAQGKAEGRAEGVPLLKAQVDDLKADKDRLQRELDSQRSENRDLTRRNDRLREENATLTSQVRLQEQFNYFKYDPTEKNIKPRTPSFSFIEELMQNTTPKPTPTWSETARRYLNSIEPVDAFLNILTLLLVLGLIWLVGSGIGYVLDRTLFKPDPAPINGIVLNKEQQLAIVDYIRYVHDNGRVQLARAQTAQLVLAEDMASLIAENARLEEANDQQTDRIRALNEALNNLNYALAQRAQFESVYLGDYGFDNLQLNDSDVVHVFESANGKLGMLVIGRNGSNNFARIYWLDGIKVTYNEYGNSCTLDGNFTSRNARPGDTGLVIQFNDASGFGRIDTLLLANRDCGL